MARISPQGVRDLNVVMEVLHENGAVNSPSMGERYNLGGRVALAKGTPGGWWGDWELNYKDQMTFEEYKKALDIDKNPTWLEKAEGGRINKKPGGIVEPGVMNYGKIKDLDPLPSPVQENLKKKFPNIKFKFDEHRLGVPSTRTPGPIQDIYDAVSAASRTKSIIGEKFVTSVKAEARKNELKNFLIKEAKDSAFRANITNLKKKFKVDTSVVYDVLDELKKDNINIKSYKLGETPIFTAISNKEQEILKKSYTTKSLSQIAAEMTGKSTSHQDTKNKIGSLWRYMQRQITEGLIDPEKVVKGVTKGMDYDASDIKGFKRRLKVEQALMDLDPKRYSNLTPSQLNYRLNKYLNLVGKINVKGALSPDIKKFVNQLWPSYEHVQGIYPGKITKDPSALEKVSIQTRKFNFDLMGARSEKGLYKDIKTYLKTAQLALEQKKFTQAKDALKVVNEIYDGVALKLKTIDRKDLPKYSIKDNKIRERNVKGLIKQRTLYKSFAEYLKNAAAVATRTNISALEKIQPNIAKVIELFQAGKDSQALALIKKRIPSIKQGKLFSAALGPIVWGSVYDDILKQQAEGKSFPVALGSQIGLGKAQEDWQEREYTKQHLTAEHINLQNRIRILNQADKKRLTPMDIAMAGERDKEYMGSPHKYIEWLRNRVQDPDQQLLWKERSETIEKGMKMSPEKLEEKQQAYRDWKNFPPVQAVEELFKSDEERAEDREKLYYPEV